MSSLQRLADRGLVRPPRWLPGNVQYETIMGSVAYGVSSDTSDVCFCGVMSGNPSVSGTDTRNKLAAAAGSFSAASCQPRARPTVTIASS